MFSIDLKIIFFIFLQLRNGKYENLYKAQNKESIYDEVIKEIDNINRNNILINKYMNNKDIIDILIIKISNELEMSIYRKNKILNNLQIFKFYNDENKH